MANGHIKYDNNHDDDRDGILLTVRMLMHGKEVGSIIGMKGDLVKTIREQTGSRIHISDSTSAERIVTVTGNIDNIFKAFSLITVKVQEFFERQNECWDGPMPPLVIKLIVPATQCGSIIGKGGSKIKEIRETTGASIQVSSDMLQNSTERIVTITGNPETITRCIQSVCTILMEAPPRGNVIPYHPTPNSNPGFLTSGLDNLGASPNPLASLTALGGLGALGGLSALSGISSGGGGRVNSAALAALAGSQLRGGSGKRNVTMTTQEITVPNEFTGCIIGRGGSKIAEIRNISGATIRISRNEEAREMPDGSVERPITLGGTPDAITVAKYLINMSVDLQKANMEAQKAENNGSSAGNAKLSPQPASQQSSTSSSSSSSSSHSYQSHHHHHHQQQHHHQQHHQQQQQQQTSPLAAGAALAQLLTKPGAIGALTSLTALTGLTDLLTGAAAIGNNVGSGGHNRPPVQTTGVHHRPGRGRGGRGDEKSGRNRFSPF